MAAHERLSYYIDYKGYSLKDFCSTFGFTYNAFTQIAAGTRPLGIQILNKIVSSLPKLNVYWLLYGNGPMEFDNENVIYKIEDAHKNISEPEISNINDPGEIAFLKYLDRPSVQEKLKMILKK